MTDAIEAQGIGTGALAHLLMTAKDSGLSDADAAHIDVALTQETLRLADALRRGAVPTEKLGASWIMPTDEFDAGNGLAEAVTKNNLKEFLTGLAPADVQYQALVAAYETYRDITVQGGWPTIPAGDEIKFDVADPRTTVLRERLAAEGYLAPKGPAEPAALAEAVKQFQTRNGMEPDGRIGKDTLAALNVPASVRVAQIAANLERWRHTPHDRGDKFIAVNTAATTLDFMMSGESVLHLRVVAGDKNHATPILFAKITGVTLNPRWEIPPSIARKEILPKLKKNPNYLADNNMVIVDGVEGDPHGQYVDWSQYTDKFPMRLRQQAGDDNSLGLMKFQMSNPQNIYLHDTPSRGAFAKFERHLSHGCVRVDQPSTLAEHVLLQTPGWDIAKINAAVATGTTRTIGLTEALPVYISYWTAFSEDGQIQFRDDIYNRDAPLAGALGITPSDAPKEVSRAASY